MTERFAECIKNAIMEEPIEEKAKYYTNYY